MILLQINKLEKSYDGEVIFSDVDFEVKPVKELPLSVEMARENNINENHCWC